MRPDAARLMLARGISSSVAVAYGDGTTGLQLQHPATTSPCCVNACVLVFVRLSRSSKVLGLVAVVLLIGIAICVHYSGFVHDFKKVPTADWYKSDILLTVLAVCQCVVLLRIPAVVRRLRHRRYWLVAAAERRSCDWCLNFLFVLLFLGGFCNRVRGGMLGPVWGLCDPTSAFCDGWGDFVGRLSMSIPTGLLVGALAGNTWLGVWFAWFMYLGNVPDWGCYYGMAQGPEHLPTGTHSDCANEARQGMFDWMIGQASSTATYEARLMRDFCGMWLRGLVWIGPAGLGVWAAGFGVTTAIGGGLMPVFYKADSWFVNESADFSGPGSPLGELIWGMFMCTNRTRPLSTSVCSCDQPSHPNANATCAIPGVMIIASLLGNHQGPPTPRNGSDRGRLDSEGFASSAQLNASLLPSTPRTPSLEPNVKEPTLLGQEFPSARAVMSTVAGAIHRAAVGVGWCMVVCTFVSAICAHMPQRW